MVECGSRRSGEWGYGITCCAKNSYMQALPGARATCDEAFRCEPNRGVCGSMTTINASLWTDITAHVRLNHPDLVRGWFVHLEPGGLNNGVLTVMAGNPAQVRYLEQHLSLIHI